MTPTAAGERVAAQARTMLGQADALRAELAALRGMLTGRVRIGVTPLLPETLDLPAAAGAFRAAHPAVRLQISSELIDPLLGGLG